MSSQSFSQLVTVNLQYNGIKITKQCSNVNCVKSVRIRGWSDAYQQKEQVLVIHVWTKNCLSLSTKERTFQTKEINLFLSVDTKTNLSLWTTKPDHFVESVRVQRFFLVWIFSCIWTEYGDLQCKSPYSLRMWRNIGQTNPECERFSRSWR